MEVTVLDNEPKGNEPKNESKVHVFTKDDVYIGVATYKETDVEQRLMLKFDTDQDNDLFNKLDDADIYLITTKSIIEQAGVELSLEEQRGFCKIYSKNKLNLTAH